MARIRTIKPEFPQSESMGQCTRDARLTFLLLFTMSDDAGRLRANSRMLASLLFPYDDDAKKHIESWLGELEHVGCIQRYVVDGDSFLAINKWTSHQKIDKPTPSKIPEPPESSRILANPRETSFTPADSPSADRKGMEGSGGESSSSSTQPKKGSRLSRDWSPSAELARWAVQTRPDLDNKSTVESFVDYWTAKPGKDASKLDWDGTFRNWVKSQRTQVRPVVTVSNIMRGVI